MHARNAFPFKCKWANHFVKHRFDEGTVHLLTHMFTYYENKSKYKHEPPVQYPMLIISSAINISNKKCFSQTFCDTQCNYRYILGGGYQRFSTHTPADAKLFATLMTNGDSCNVFKCLDFPCTIVIP